MTEEEIEFQKFMADYVEKMKIEHRQFMKSMAVRLIGYIAIWIICLAVVKYLERRFHV